ncbi:MAG: hypothetical protein FWH42_05700 [Dehalococcoidia bacterium]|nr:hypothetical protein [Dehalococcoidia bacterium]
MKRKLVFAALSAILVVSPFIIPLSGCKSSVDDLKQEREKYPPRDEEPISSNDKVLVFIDPKYTHLLEEEALEFNFDDIDKINYNYKEVTRKLTLGCSLGLSTWEEINAKVDIIKSREFVESADYILGGASAFTVIVKEEYNKKFDEELFKINDFGIAEATSLKYIHYSKTYFHEVTVTLKSHGQQNVQQAIEHFKTLPFVKSARALSEFSESNGAFSYDTVLVVLTQAYSLPKNIVLTPTDFNFTNVGSVVYLTTHPNDIPGYQNSASYRNILAIHLIECSEQNIIDAIEHFKQLPFVEYAEPNYILHMDDSV